MNDEIERAIARHLRRGSRVAIADGAGAPVALSASISRAASAVGGVSLILGWCLEMPVEMSPGAFSDVRTTMSGFALRKEVDAGSIAYVPTRLTSVPSLMTDALRPDVLLISLRASQGGWDFGTDVSWMESLLHSGTSILIHENNLLPRTYPSGRLDKGIGTEVGRADRQPFVVERQPKTAHSETIGKRAASLVPEGAVLQFGPGGVGSAVLEHIRNPVSIRTGIITDDVMDLVERGLVLGAPVGAYVLGSERLYAWADNRELTAPLPVTHGPALPGSHFVAINGAIEIDHAGQVNVERSASQAISGVGGHPDFSLIGSRSGGGVSVIAIPSIRHGKSTLVRRLSAPTSTLRSDVDVVVTEMGIADLRGLSDSERGTELRRLWGKAQL